MPADPRIGGSYLTASGLPVRVARVDAAALILQSLTSDNEFSVPASYALRPFVEAEAAFERRPAPYQPRAPRARKGPGEPKALAPIIDALLLAGRSTMRGILRELRRKASAACRGKDLKANVRARLYWFKRKGYRTETNSQGLIKATLPAASR
jgi:hypothetical protein